MLLEDGLFLITGGNGIGKTSLVINQIKQRLKKTPDLKVYVHAIVILPEANIPHKYVYCRNENCYWCYMHPKENSIELPPINERLYVDQWFNFGANSLVVVDEATYVFPQRGSTSKNPEHVDKLVNRRALGIDAYVICPEPQIDHVLKSLATQHIHFMPFYFGLIRMVIFSTYQTNPNDNRSKGRTTLVLPNKKSFGLYLSAKIHRDKLSRKLPISYILFGLCAGYFLFNVADIIFDITEPAPSTGFIDPNKNNKTEEKSIEKPINAPPPINTNRNYTPPANNISPSPVIDKPVKSANYRVGGSFSIGAITKVFIESTNGRKRSFSISADFCQQKFGEYECHYEGEYITVDSGVISQPQSPINQQQYQQIAQTQMR